VLDEPTSQLDPKSAEDVLNSLVRLNADLGLTIVLAEHRLERVLPFADRLVYLSPAGGELLSGEPRRVLEQIDLAPPLARLGKALGWSPLPLTTREGLRFSRTLHRAQAAGERGATEHPARGDRPFIAVRNAAYAYRGGRAALRDVTLEVWPGEIVALLGRNGAGKSTLLKSIVGLVRPARGAVLVDGEDVRDRPTAAISRKVGYLPQDPNALLFADEVQQELGITLRNHGLPAATPTALARISSHLASLHLGEKAGAYPRDLSVGERQRVALAAVTVTAPGALILDEPTRGLDYQAKAALAALLKRWRAEGMAILLVTHDVELAAALADRVLLMSQGEIIAQGPPAEVMGASPLFAPQMARLFPGRGWLTVEDVLSAIN
jgi:energy-coupling factor transport system ATP-binding protein